jgi:thiol-disulfide isomerase/thioredoxin
MKGWVAPAVVSALLVATPAPAHHTPVDASPRTGSLHALLINGGSAPATNYLSHLQHLKDMVDLLRRRGVAPERIHVFSADGEDAGADLATRDVLPPDFWLLEGTDAGNRLKPRVEQIDTRWDAVRLHPARLAGLREWFGGAQRTILPGDRLFVFVTDHGTSGRGNPEQGAISLWHEKLTVAEFRTLLAKLAPGVQVVFLMSQCYSGAFAGLMSTASNPPPSDVCGFFSTTADDRAYGCYPEGSDRDRLGHAFEFIEALGRRTNTALAHLDVMVSDAAPDRPLRTSDVYLARLVAAEAARRGATVDETTDALLGEAWRNRGAWEPEIRLLDAIGNAFGTFSPRRVAELAVRRRDLAGVTKEMRSAADRWKAGLNDLRATLLARFVDTHPDWRAALAPAALDTLSAGERAERLGLLLAEYGAFAGAQDDLWPRIEHLHDFATRGSEAAWRLEVRLAAADRMRTILVGIAGRVLVGRDRRQPVGRETADALEARSLDRLEACEALEPGRLPRGDTSSARPGRDPFPPLASDLALLDEIQPSWLGLRFAAVPDAVRRTRALSAGASRVEAVEPDSPARDAGITQGDIVLGPPGHPFASRNEIREWTMTSPRDVPLPLVLLRGAASSDEAQEIVVSVTLRSYPAVSPALADPPAVGAAAPVLAGGLAALPGSQLPDVSVRAHLLFFWATWCGPCKLAVPEVLAFAAARGLPVLAVTDESAEIVSRFLARRKDPFFESIAIDAQRKYFVGYGVSGTPTIVLVDGTGTVRLRQVGYRRDRGLEVEGWHWAGGQAPSGR